MNTTTHPITARELYEILEAAGVDFEIVEIFEGARFIRVEVTERAEQ